MTKQTVTIPIDDLLPLLAAGYGVLEAFRAAEALGEHVPVQKEDYARLAEAVVAAEAALDAATGDPVIVGRGGRA